jgi:tetratricopeptide (TPR) repeat protein
MTANPNTIPDAWLPPLGGGDTSGWLSVFAASPREAVDDLIRDAFYFGPLNLTDRGQLLAGWLDLLGDTDGFAERLDAEFAGWVEGNWGRFDGTAASLVSAWNCLLSVVEISGKLPAESQLVRSAAALRGRFHERRGFLGSFTTGPSSDPLGLYVSVIAQFQSEDRSLAPFWQQICGLPDGVPFYHARYAMLGLRRLKATDPAEQGTLRAEIVLGLLRLARAFDRLVRERGLAESIAKSTFHRVALEASLAYPNSSRWVEHGLDEFSRLPERAQKWVRKAVRPLADVERRGAASTRDRRARSIRPDASWADRARNLVSAVASGAVDRLADLERLVAEQKRYAEVTGDTYYVVRTLCSTASRLSRLRPDDAAHWAEEARGWEPYDPYTWNIVRTIFLRQHDLDRALVFAWIAWKRFPANAVAANGLAEALRAAHRYEEAERVYRDTVEKFPDDAFPRTGLAEVLRAAHRYEDAERVYRDTVEKFPDNAFARNGLAEVLRAASRYEEAERVYRDTVEKFPDDVVARNGLAEVLRAAHRYEEAERVYRHAVEQFPNNVVARTGLAEVLRAAHRYEDAERVYRDTVEQFPNESVARTGLADTLRQAGRLREAEEEYRRTVRMGLANAMTFLGLGHLVLHRGAAGRKEAIELVTRALTLQPGNRSVERLRERIEAASATDLEKMAAEWNEPAESLPGSQTSRVSTEEETWVAEDEAIPLPETEIPEVSENALGVPTDRETWATEHGAVVLPEAETPEVGEKGYGSASAHQEELAGGPVEAPEPRSLSKGEKRAGEQEADEDKEGTGKDADPQDSAEMWQVTAHEVLAPASRAELTIERYEKPRELQDPLYVAASVAECYFYRMWAEDAEGDTAKALRQKARNALARAERLAPEDPSVLGEQTALAADQGNESLAYQSLSAKLSSHPAAVPLLILQARMDRERARKERRPLSESALADLTEAPQRLRNLDPLVEPLFHLQRGAAALALLDGSARVYTAADELSRFRRMVAARAGAERTDRDNPRERRSSAVAPFYEWVQTRANNRLFAPIADTLEIGAEHIPIIEESFAENRFELNQIEDLFADRLTFWAV